VTLILTVNGPEAISLLADRRLSYEGREPKDDARKVMFLETVDGVAILGYAGLGATAMGTEPADWMSAVLRGRNLPLEQCLGVLAEAMKQQFPRHLMRMPGTPVHNIFVPAFLDNEVRLYTIDLVFAPDRKRYFFRYTRHLVEGSAPVRTPRIGLAGSGVHHLVRDKRWMRSLLRLVRAHDRGQLPPLVVADHLASLNNEVHRQIPSVGPRCIVAWRYRSQGVVQNGGGDHQLYTGATREDASPALPLIGTGIDIRALGEFLVHLMSERFAARRAGNPPPDLDEDELNAGLARVPDKPNENLQ